MERSILTDRSEEIQISRCIQCSEIFVYNDIQLIVIRLKRIYKTKPRISFFRF